jgi:excisionase family DNA binding protein
LFFQEVIAVMEYMTVTQVARILRKRKAFVRDEIKAGSLRAVKLGPRGTRISEEALQAYINKMPA